MTLTVQHLHVNLDGLCLANDMNFSLQPGQVHAIIGPNGTGKSTLLKAIFGQIKPQVGTIQLDEHLLVHKRLAAWRQHFGYMPQDISLDIGLTAIEVVLLGQLDALSFRVDDHQLSLALQVMSEIGLAHLAHRDVRTLSGGQRQMILFAQVLLRQPRVMMLDEPVSALDLNFQHVLLEHLGQKTRSEQWISLMVLHDLNLAAQYADQLLVLKDGHLIAHGSPAEVLTADLIHDVYDVNVAGVL